MSDDTPPTTSAGAPSAGPQKIATTVTAGTLILGTYEIEQIINSGGMGEVYRGRNIHNGEPVAKMCISDRQRASGADPVGAVQSGAGGGADASADRAAEGHSLETARAAEADGE